MSRTKIFIFLLLLAAIGAGFYYVPRSRPFESYTQRAAEAFQLKEFEHSIELYLKALKYYPGHPRTAEVILTIGDIYNFSLGNSEKASKAYEMLENRFPKSPETLKAFRHAGEMDEKNEQFEKALLDYQGLVDRFPDAEGVDEARFSVAMMAVKLKKFEPARRSLMAIVDKNPDTPVADKVLYQLGNIFFMEGSSKEAVEVLKVASEKYKDSPLLTEMQFTMANAYEEMGQIDNAMKIYKAIRYTYPNPRVVEKKIEKLNDRYKETKMFEQRALQAAKAANQAKGVPTTISPESQKSIKANFIRRKKDSALDKSLMELMEGEP
ncbi:MAG: tetratricopeptide repeat protein [Deltaproteobacteria bacterium]|nr:tetratricopeptide repeat protein [Deltaproteobacteria bacterium]